MQSSFGAMPNTDVAVYSWPEMLLPDDWTSQWYDARVVGEG